MKQIAGIDFQIKKLDDAKEWQKKFLPLIPKILKPPTIGEFDWTEAHEYTLAALQAAGLNDDGEGDAKAPKR